jgi:hypothetical protein
MIESQSRLISFDKGCKKVSWSVALPIGFGEYPVNNIDIADMEKNRNRNLIFVFF